VTNLGRSYAEADEALVNFSVILPQNIFAMFNQIICYCVAVSRRAALQLPGVAIPRNERMYAFQIRSNVYFIAYLGFLMRAGDRGPAPSMYC